MRRLLDKILIKEIIYPVLIILIAVVLYLILKGIVNNIFRIKSNRIDKRMSKTINSLVNNLIKYFIIIIAFVMILEVYGVDTMTLIASLGAFGVVAGLAVQDSLKDLICGISIILEGQYRVGDNVTIKGFKGEVIELGIKSTKIRAYSGEVMIIANHLIEEVINHSLEKSVVVIDIPVSYDTDIDKLEKILNDLFGNLNNSVSGLKSEIKLLGLDSYGDNAMNFRVSVDTIPMENYRIGREIRKAIKMELDKHKIEIPFSQVVIHNGKRV